MQEQKIESIKLNQKDKIQSNPFFLPQVQSILSQKQKLKCLNNNQSYLACIQSSCQKPGLMCFDIDCECKKPHSKCLNVFIERVLKSIESHHKKVTQKVRQTYQTIYDLINQMIDKLSNLRTQFQKQEQYFGLTKDQQKLLELINENKIQQINGKILNSLSKNFDYEVQINSYNKEIILKDYQEKRKNFDKIIQYILKNYQQFSSKKNKLSKNYHLLFSKIVQNQEQISLLDKWLCEVAKNENKQLQLILLFRGSQHGFQAKEFHKLCDNKDCVLVILKNQHDKIIGGFSTKGWNAGSDRYIQQSQGQSFMFSLTLRQKLKCISLNSSIYYGKQFGPSFGNGSDLRLGDKCNLNSQSCINLGHSYNFMIQNKMKYEKSSMQSQKQFIGGSSFFFKVKEYQVYQVKGLYQNND